MVRNFKNADIDKIMEIWLNSNIEAHNFIDKSYWKKNFEMVKNALPQAEIYIYEENNNIMGFVGLVENYIAGIFVEKNFREKGTGKKLLDYAKSIKNNLTLNVYEKNIDAVKFYKREGFTVEKFGIDKSTDEKEFMMSWEK